MIILIILMSEDFSGDNRIYLWGLQHNTHQGNPFNPKNPGSDNTRTDLRSSG
ncbi:hypothetical protein [Chitinophaga niastensis]|uniref:hypothetical protein n=1 Tax=Chitinophaga niastensis TaxID=536980 RepID=UPI001304D4BA|nr:hypothetical protein [Chitinophaga niastensis]